MISHSAYNQAQCTVLQRRYPAAAVWVSTAIVCLTMLVRAQAQTPTIGVTEAQAEAMTESLAASARSSTGAGLTPAQTQALLQYLAAQSQTVGGTGAGLMNPASAVQAQVLRRSFAAMQAGQNTAPGGGVPALAATAGGAPMPTVANASTSAGPKKPGVPRIGVVTPQAQLSSGPGSSVAEPIRGLMMSYLNGPAVEVIPLSAMLATQINCGGKTKRVRFRSLFHPDSKEKRRRVRTA